MAPRGFVKRTLTPKGIGTHGMYHLSVAETMDPPCLTKFCAMVWVGVTVNNSLRKEGVHVF